MIASHPRRTLVGLVALLVLTALPTTSALAACDAQAPAISPVLSPDTPYEEFKPGDPARFSGTVQVDCGWSYRRFGEPSGQARIEYLDSQGSVLGTSDVTQQVQVAADGTISGTAPTVFSGSRASATRLRLWMKATSATAEVAEGRSPEVVVDGVQPSITGYALTSPTTIVVVFSEPVVVENGDRITDWRIDDDRPREVTGSGAQRTLTLFSAKGEDATPEVFYRAFDPLDPSRQEYRDDAGNRLDDANRIADAADEIPPSVPVFSTIAGADPDATDPVVAGTGTPRIEVTGVTDGHRVRLYRDNLQDATRVFDAGDDVLLATETKQPGQPLVIEPADYDAALPEEVGGAPVTHTLYLQALDGADNASGDVDVARYRVDTDGPSVVPPAVADGEFVTVRFDEPVQGPNEAAEWGITGGASVVSVSGSGDVRLLRVSGTATGSVTYDPAKGSTTSGLADDTGNPVAAFSVPIVSNGALTVVAGAPATEGSPLTFTVTVARAEGNSRTYGVSYATESGTATSGSDFTATSGTLTFSGTTTTRTVTVPTLEDEATEGDETLRLRLSSPTNGATLPSPPTATGTIRDPSGLPEVAVYDTRANEGTTARVAVRLDRAAADDVTVRWRTRDGSATSSQDYTPGSGTLRIAAGATTGELVVALTEDETTEPTETFDVVLSDPVGATLGRATAEVSILDGVGVPPGIARVAGASRVETSVEVSRSFFDRADTVVIATADAYPDALAGAPLAAANDAPILLSTRDRLHPATRDEVTRLGARTAIVLGGGKALAARVDDDLRAAGVRSVHRVAGRNRFETAQRIAAELGGDAVYVVEGANADPARGWPDAVAVSALAAYQQRPILLVERDRLPSETRAALRSLAPSRATIVGGTAAVNDAVAVAVDAEAGTVSRTAGRTRYETSLRIAEASVQAGMDPATTWFATGDDWPDSLSASPAVARTGGVLLLVDSDRLDDSPPAREWLVRYRGTIESITLVGGTKAISAGVESQIRSQSGLAAR